MTQAARRLPAVSDRVKSQGDNITDLYSLMRIRHLQAQRISLPILGTGSAAPIDGGGEFLRTAGDTMIGPIAFFPNATTIASGAIDIGKTSGNFTSYIIVLGQGAADDFLDTITGAAHAGQILYMQAVITTKITLTNSGNIITADGANLDVNGGNIATLIFDPTVPAGGKWRVVSVSLGVAGGSGATNLNALTDVTLTTPTKGSLLAYDGTVWIDVDVGTNGFFLKADSGQTAGIAWSATSGTEVPVWTQNHNTDGYSLTVDQDGDSRWQHSRSGIVGDDQVGLSLGDLSAVDFLFDRTGSQGIFSIFDRTTSETLAFSKTSTQGQISSPDIIALQIVATDKFSVSVSAVTLGTAVNIAMANNDIQALDRLRFALDSAAPTSSSDPSIFLKTDTMIFNMPTADQFQWNINDVAAFFGGNKVGGTADAFFRVFGKNTVIPNLEIENDKDTPATGIMGRLGWFSQNGAAASTLYAEIDADNLNISSGSEESRMRLRVFDGGTLQSYIILNNNSDGKISFAHSLLMPALIGDIELQSNDLWLALEADATKISGSATGALLNIGGTPIWVGTTTGFSLQSNITLSIAELFAMSATTATGLVDGTMWHDSGTGDILCRTGGVEKNLSDIATGGGGVTLPIAVDELEHGNVTGLVTISLSATTAHYHTMTLTGDVNFTFTNPPASNKVIQFTLDITQDATGGRKISFNDTLETSAVQVKSSTNARTVIIVETRDGGATYSTFGSALTPTVTDVGNKWSDAVDSNIIPTGNNNVFDLGSSGAQFKDIWIDGKGFIDTLQVHIGVESNLEPISDATYDLGQISPTNLRWRDIFASGQIFANQFGVNSAMNDGAGFDMGNNFEIFDEMLASAVTTPTFDGTIRIFLDQTVTPPELSVKKFGGSTVSLEASAAGGDAWGDPVDANIIPDSTANDRDLGSATNRFNNIWADAQATLGVLDVGGTIITTAGTLQMNGQPIQTTGAISPNSTGTSDIGTASLHYNDIYLDGNVLFRGLGDVPAATDQYIRGTTTQMLFNIRSADADFIFRKASLDQLRISMNVGAGNNESIIRAGGGKKIGFHPDTSNAIGTEGALGIPFKTGTESTASQANTDFGSFTGAQGVYFRNNGDAILFCIKAPDGDWRCQLINSGAGGLKLT